MEIEGLVASIGAYVLIGWVDAVYRKHRWARLGENGRLGLVVGTGGRHERQP